MADEAVEMEGTSPAQSPLVTVTFQRDTQRKQKYLEAEPKALGITQIGLSMFQVLCVSVFLSKGLGHAYPGIPFFIASLLVMIAGGVAVAAKNLHMPTLRACLGMQVVACVASLFNMIFTLINMDIMHMSCWHYYDYNNTQDNKELCHQIEEIQSHFFTEGALIQAVLLAISATLFAYCYKVINCCTVAPKTAVITVQGPPVPAAVTVPTPAPV